MSEGADVLASIEAHQVWTFADLQVLPDEIYRRFEIIDGALVVSPSASLRHQRVAGLLQDVLHHALDPAFWVVADMSIDIDPSYLIPDLVVVTREAGQRERNLVSANEVLLVTEIVSPGSRTKDRFTKPALYAQTGIPVYLRVETLPGVAITVYELDGDTYRDCGTFGAGETVHLESPFAVDIPIDAITP